MGSPTPGFAIERGRIRLANTVLVYLERTLAPPEPLPAGVAPRSYGLAPTAVSLSLSGSVLAPVRRGEAVWLGFQAVNPAVPAIVRVRVDETDPVDGITGGRWDDALAEAPRNYLLCPPDYCLPGIMVSHGHQPFGRGDLTVLTYAETRATVSVRLVSPEVFTSATGLVAEPIDPETAYKGWRLP